MGMSCGSATHLKHLVWPAVGVVGGQGGGRPAAACVASIMQTDGVLAVQGDQRVILRREVGIVELAQLCPGSVGRGCVKMRRRRWWSRLLLSRQTCQHSLRQLELFTSTQWPVGTQSHKQVRQYNKKKSCQFIMCFTAVPITKEFMGIVQCAHWTRR